MIEKTDFITSSSQSKSNKNQSKSKKSYDFIDFYQKMIHSHFPYNLNLCTICFVK